MTSSPNSETFVLACRSF